MYEQLRNTLKEYARVYRSFALQADRTSEIPKEHLLNSDFKGIWGLGIPQEYGYEGFRLNDGTHVYGDSSTELVICTEELAYGDPGMTLSMPGAQLLGPIVNELGSKDQKERFFRSFLEESQPVWTGFNLTEEKAGSDVNGIQTIAEKNGDNTYLLTGEKRYIANAERAQWVVVYAKMGNQNNAFAIQSFLLHKSEFDNSFCIRNIDRTLGMKAARLGHTIYNNLPVSHEQILGHDRSPLRRGLRSAVNVFFRMRPCTSSIAIGTARGMIDYAKTHIDLTSNEEILVNKLEWKLEKARQLVYRAAHEVDNGVFNAKSSSMAKWMSNRTVYEVGREIFRLAGPEVLIEHPLLEKWLRDSKMIEFMEGSTNIHKREVSQEILRIN
ncbi:acyl-CoA dehydrogenase family protein [Priestia koreensis]|uniref:acyl-CoA dehydrogenase family protein n=1 Tax=Priestia koreensis TaxID=284581 RepID=UPI003CFCCABC